jgi:hypothetical protein
MGAYDKGYMEGGGGLLGGWGLMGKVPCYLFLNFKSLPFKGVIWVHIEYNYIALVTIFFLAIAMQLKVCYNSYMYYKGH